MSFNWETEKKSCLSILETPMGRRPCCAVTRRRVAFSQMRIGLDGRESEPTFAFAHAAQWNAQGDRGGTQMPKNDGFLTKRPQVSGQRIKVRHNWKLHINGKGSYCLKDDAYQCFHGQSSLHMANFIRTEKVKKFCILVFLITI